MGVDLVAVVAGEFGEAVFDCFLTVGCGEVNGCALHFGDCVLHKSLGNDKAVFWFECHKVRCH